MKISDLAAVLAFAKVAELKSFRAAARALDAPKSTVSRKVSELEDRLGVRLFERTTRAVRLTGAGESYYRQVAPGLQAMSEAERGLADEQATPTGVLRVTAPTEFAQFALGRVIGEYLHRCPSVEVQVELTDRMVNLVEEGFDVGIRPGMLPDSTLMVRKIGAPERLRVYASNDYLRRRNAPRHPEELTDHDCLVMSSMSRPTTWVFRERDRPITVQVRPRIAVNSFHMLCDLTIAGQGIARLPEFIGERERAKGILHTVLDEFTEPGRHWQLVYPSSRNASSKVAALLELFGDITPEGSNPLWSRS